MLLKDYRVINKQGKTLARTSLHYDDVLTDWVVCSYWVEYYDDMYGGSHSYIEDDERDFDNLERALECFNRRKNMFINIY